MLTITEKLSEPVPAHTTLTLAFDLRQKSRLRVNLDDGREAGVMLARGTVLRGGDLLRATDGSVIEVQAAPEAVSTAFSRDPALLTRAAYHLGNRHIAVEIGTTWLRYLHDHVLDHLLEQLGLQVFFEHAPFEPEAGAYEAQGHPPHHAAGHADTPHDHDPNNDNHHHGHNHGHDHNHKHGRE
ncbi:MAG: urease accessory protein UreE [Gammaproteobacteria bacterium]